ncbi:MAG: monoheme cytochrome C [Croceivirga sp.]
MKDGKSPMTSRKKLLSVFVLLLAMILGLFYLKKNPNIFKRSTSYEDITEVEVSFIELDSLTISKSGFVNDIGVSQVIQNCTQCHSTKLVTQNRMSEEGWESTITWMQETQNLWDLGQNHERIVTYLAKNYGPEQKGRRQNLTNLEWYELE